MYIVFDLETNGIGYFRPVPTQTITQLAYIKFNRTGDIIEKQSHIIRGAKQINTNIPSVKITLDDIKEYGIDPIDAITQFFSIIEPGDILFSHNSDFDSGLLKEAIKNTNLSFPKNTLVCTMKNSTEFCKLQKKAGSVDYGGYKWPALHELASKLNIKVSTDNLHDALYDCTITKECIIKGMDQGIF